MTTTKKAPTKCNNFLFEEDGYCPKCGKYHFSIAFGRVTFHNEKPVDLDGGYSEPFAEIPEVDQTTAVWDAASQTYRHQTLTVKRLVDDKPVDVIVVKDGQLSYVARDIRTTK
jgi:hypothetical protein